jgi:antibiotic biosynthesis monooxygenase (ABM) superfamily enzyme
MAVVTWFAVFPLVQIMNGIVMPHLGFLPPVARGLVVSWAMIAVMTYVMMPQLSKLFARWLYPPS